MYKSKRKILGNNEGSILLTVIAIMTFATILTVGAMSFVQQANKKTFKNVNTKQAYYTASGCLETFVETVMTDENQWTQFESIASTGGESQLVDLGAMGTCTIKVEKPASGMIKVTSTAEVNGFTERVVCHLKAQTTPGESTFENAIELAGDSNAGYNNINVIGDMAGSKENQDMVYYYQNDSHMYGKYFQYGSLVVNTKLFFHESISGKGVSLTASKYLMFGQNEVGITSNIKKEDNSVSNFINAGNTLIISSKMNIGETSVEDPVTYIRPSDVDVFAGGIVFALQSAGNNLSPSTTALNAELATTSMPAPGSPSDGYVQYGNIYCYDNGTVMHGDFVVDGGGYNNITINGNVFVEGDLYCAKATNFKVNGNLYVLGEIIGSPTVENGKIYNTILNTANPLNSLFESLDKSTFDSFKTLRGSTPATEYEGTRFVYYPEDLLISTDANISTISSKYKNLVANVATKKTLEDYKPTGTDKPKYDGVEFDIIVTGDCYITQSDMWNDKYKNILILVTDSSKDIVIVFENGCNIGNDRNIVVKNETKIHEDSKTEKPSFCYFTVDTYTIDAKLSYELNDDGSVKTASHTGFTLNSSLKISKGNIFDFDTWKNCLSSIPINGTNGGTKAFNITDKEIIDSNVYSPVCNYIVYLFTQDTIVNIENDAIIEGTIYAKEASINMNQGKNIKLCTKVGGTTVDKQVCLLGTIMAKSFTASNTTYVVYYKPSSKSDLKNLGIPSGSKISGFEISRFTNNIT